MTASRRRRPIASITIFESFKSDTISLSIDQASLPASARQRFFPNRALKWVITNAGGSRRIFEDEVRSKLETYPRRARWDPKDDTFVDRRMRYDVCELTSRVPTNDVAAAKRRLAQPFY